MNTPTQNSAPRTQNSAPRPLEPAPLLHSLLTVPEASITDLLKIFDCSVDDLSHAIHTPDFLKRFKLQTQLAYIQSRLAASRHIAAAIEKTISLMNESEKPEVSRRAAAALIQMAGLPIRTASQPAPAPMPEPPPPELDLSQPLSTRLEDILQALANAPEIRDFYGINLKPILAKDKHAFLQNLQAFYKSRR